MKFKEIIEQLLKDEPKTRSDDKWLAFRVYQEIARQNGKEIYIPFELFNAFPAFETIIRTRAKLQNEEGKYLSKDEELPQEQKGIIVVETNPKLKNSWMV